MLTRFKMISIVTFLLIGNTVNKQVMAEMNESTMLKLTCEISAPTPQSIEDGIWLTFSITSNQNTSIKILPWHTPLEGIFSHFFTIKDKSDRLLSYQGPLMKRAAPVEADYVSLKAAETKSNRVNLSNVYNFERQQSYQVSLENFKVEVINADNSRQSVNCDSNTLSISIM